MLGNRTFPTFLLVWLMALGAAPAILKLNPSPSSSRPEPIEVEPETLASVPQPANLD